MFGRWTVCFAMCVTVYVKSASFEATAQSEATCLAYGGMCVEEGDCPVDNLAPLKGLCPTGPKEPRSECCFGLPTSATGCLAQGGECFPLSYECSTQKTADDCENDQKCCILVN